MDTVVLGGAGLARLEPRSLLDTLAAYVACGGKVIDVSPAYFGWEGLERLGAALSAFGQDLRPLIKVGYFRDRSAYLDPSRVRAQARRVVALLKHPPAALLLHEADWDTWWLDGGPWARGLGQQDQAAVSPAIDVLRDLGQAWGVRVGLSGNNAGRISAGLKWCGGADAMIAKQVDLLWSAGDDVVERQDGHGTLLAAPFHQGWLMRLGALGEAREDMRSAARALEQLLEERELTVAQIALPFLAARWPGAGIVVGAVSPAEVETAFASLSMRLETDLLDQLQHNRRRAAAMPGAPLREGNDDLLAIDRRH
jgi:aryl-alcohol dehydrogenase-like predicted oxidoreductase